MNKIADTELILNNDRIYHLNLSKDMISDNIILVGDPGRVDLVSNKFDKIIFKEQHREFVTHTGFLKNKMISVISTGIGTDNIDIVVNELDALVNINLKTRTINKVKKKLNFIRIGTSGSLQKNLNVDTILVSKYAIGLDNLAHFYKNTELLEVEMLESFLNFTNWPNELSKPYFIKSSSHLYNIFNDLPYGITATAAGFYGPQGRSLRMENKINDLNQILSSFKFNQNKISNFEMETSALYFLARSLGHNALTICALIGNRIQGKYSKDYQKIIDKTINLVLQRITQKR